MTQNLGKITETLASLNVAELKRDVVGAVRDMMREESVSQVCAQRQGPPARDTLSTAHASEKRREKSAPPAREGAGKVASKGLLSNARR